MQYSPNEIISPFWAENSGFKTGRDPLGIQNSSVATYSRLLPGMTNQTQRIRYYGFYCWLLNVYHTNYSEITTTDLLHQYNFIRRSELLLAFMMVNLYPNERAVVGSQYVENHLTDDIIKLKLGAEKEASKGGKKEYYWEYPSGALGQYYVGSLINLGLLEMRARFFVNTEKGNLLAEAYKESIPETERILFLELINKDELPKEEVLKLKSFAVNQIVKDSNEWDLYKTLLTEINNQDTGFIDTISSYLRKETILSYFEYLENSDSDIDFQTWCFINKEKNENPKSAVFGWYYYFICEAFHFSYEAIFWSMLVLSEQKYYLVSEFIEKFIEELEANSNEQFRFSANETLENTILNLPEKDIVESLNELEKLCKSDINYSLALNKAIELILLLFFHINADIEKIKEFELMNNLQYQKGHVTEFCNLLVNNNLNLKFTDFVQSLILLIINDHTSTAFRKMGDSEASLLKFIIEDNIISHIQTLSPVHTNPRLNTLRNMMRDLGFTKDNQITSEAKALIAELQSKE